MSKYYFFGYLALIVISFSCNANAYWGNTHEKIARESIKNKNTLLDLQVKNIGLASGFNEKFNGYNLELWVENGSVNEDKGIRFRNHFYNPLDGSGLSDVFIGSSSYEWADQINSGWSWRNSRLSFYRGMTATSDVERRSALADSFRALGQVMHLIQDNAVPAHVRNDLHMIPDGFEAYASRNVDSLSCIPIAFSGQKNSISTYAPRQFWDSDQYDGTNPSTSAAIGLAEYTNANFASEDTVFTENYLDDWSPLNNKHYFPYPRQADMVVVDESQNRIGMNGYVIYRKYFEKICGGEIIRHFATASRLYEHLLDDPEPSIQGFDDHCYKDYADLLIPRAVGYSAGLIDYFFRGEIDMEPDSGQYLIKNESDENMSGAFRLYYDDKYDMRKLVPGVDWSNWNLSIPANGKSSPVTFSAPSDAKEPGKYMLVFLGTHGAESGAVVGKEVTVQSKDGVIKIRLTGPDGGQIKRDIIFNVWAKRKDTGTLCKVAAISWKYDVAADYWEVTVPSLSDAIEYNATYNRYDTVTPVGGFDLTQGVYLDYLWKASAVGVLPATYTGKGGYYGYTYHEEETRNLAQNLISLGLKIGYKPNTQPIPGIEVLTIFPKDNYSIQLVYDAAKKQIDLAGGTRLVVAANDEGVYGLSQRGYSSMIIKVTPSALPATNYSFEFSINSGRLDKSRIIKSGSVWTQYPGKYRTDQRYLSASKLDLKQNRVLEDIIPYIYTEQTSDVSSLDLNQLQVSSIELSSNMEYSINYNGTFYAALWRKLDGQGEIVLRDKSYCWTISRVDSSDVFWDNVNGECGWYSEYNPLSWVPSGNIAWVDTDSGRYSLFPVSLIHYKNFEFTPGTRTHYMKSEHSIPSTLTYTEHIYSYFPLKLLETKIHDYNLLDVSIFKGLQGPSILLRD